MDVGKTALTSLLSLVVMFGLSRIGGKRQIAQMSMFDYVNSITVGSIAAELATELEAPYRPLTALFMYGGITWLAHMCACKTLKGRTILDGRASILMENGTIYKKALSKAGIDLNEFLGQARVAGYFDLNEVQCAVLEVSGQISFLPRADNRPVTPQDLQLHPSQVSMWTDLILDGVIMRENLDACGRGTEWLKTQLHRYGIGQSGEAFYAGCDREGNFFACRGK